MFGFAERDISDFVGYDIFCLRQNVICSSATNVIVTLEQKY